MSKRLKQILSLILVFAVVLSVGAAAAVDEPGVFYNGATREIQFRSLLNVGQSTPPDLFTNLKNMMPGDSVTEEIRVGAINIGTDTVKIYLRSQNPNAAYTELVSGEYARWVTFTVSNGDEEITGDLAEGVELGLFRNGEKSTIAVTLTIAPEAGNELQALVAEIDWVFTAEVYPAHPEKPGIPGFGESVLATGPDHICFVEGYPDGTIHPNEAVTRAEVAVMLYRLLDSEVRENLWTDENSYYDVPGEAWFNEAVSTLTNGGFLVGMPDGGFHPNDPITRAEVVVILCRIDGGAGRIDGKVRFPDVGGHWAEAYINYAADMKYVIGYLDGNFGPDRNITRAEMVAMLNRLLDRAVDEEGLLEGYHNWPDNKPGSWYYYDIIEANNYHKAAASDRLVEKHGFYYENWSEFTAAN